MGIGKNTLRAMAATLVVFSVAHGTGDCGAQFLKMGVGARACAMGEAFTGVADDPSALFWNQAGLSQLNRVGVLAMQNFWLLDMSYQYLAFAVPSAIGTFGVSAAYSSSGTIPGYENFQETVEYTAYDAAATLSYGRNIVRIGAGSLGLGLGGRVIQQAIENEAALGFAGDLGILYTSGGSAVEHNASDYRTPGRQYPGEMEPPTSGRRDQGSAGRRVLFNVGLAVRNVGPGTRFIEQADPLPLNVSLGASGRIGPVLLAADAGKYLDSKVRVGVGAEVTLFEVLALRAGYNTANSFSAGGGITWGAVTIDYSFTPYEHLNPSNRISARVRF